MVGQVVGKVTQKAATKGAEKLIQGIVSIAKAKNISQYFNALRNWNKAAFKAGEFKTSPQVSDKNVFKANENRFNVLESYLMKQFTISTMLTLILITFSIVLLFNIS